MVAFANPSRQPSRQQMQWTLADIVKRSAELLYPVLVRLCVPKSHGNIDLEFSFQDGYLNHISVGDEDMFPLDVELEGGDDEESPFGCDNDSFGDDESEVEGEESKPSSVSNTLKDALAVLKLKLEASMIRDFFGTVTLSIEICEGVCEMVSCKSRRVHKVASAKIP